MANNTILELRGLTTLLGGSGGLLQTRQPVTRAVDGVELAVDRGQIFGVVGESGCGKSTLGRTILGIQSESAGEIRFDGQVVSGLRPVAARRVRSNVQYVHQDAGASLDPWWSIGRSLREPLVVHGLTDDADSRTDEMLFAVGLDPSMKGRYPHELSGGQLRRVALARILLLSPKLVILDEPTSGLDVSVQAGVLKLLRDLRERLNLTYIFISHDLSVVRLMCDRVAIMYLGKIVEEADAEGIFSSPRHPYTRALLSAAPKLTRQDLSDPNIVAGELPSASNVPSGCAFRTRCRFATDVCAREFPPRSTVSKGHTVRCHHWRDLPAFTA